MSPTRESAVAGKCPDQSRGGRYECDGANSNDEGDEDDHACGAIAGGVGHEDVHEGHAQLAGWALEGGVDVERHEQDGDDHCEAEGAVQERGADHGPRNDYVCVSDFFGHL